MSTLLGHGLASSTYTVRNNSAKGKGMSHYTLHETYYDYVLDGTTIIYRLSSYTGKEGNSKNKEEPNKSYKSSTVASTNDIVHNVSIPINVAELTVDGIQFIDSQNNQYSAGSNGTVTLIKTGKLPHPTNEPQICKRWHFNQSSNSYEQTFDPINPIPNVGYKNVYDFDKDEWKEVINPDYQQKASALSIIDGIMGMTKK